MVSITDVAKKAHVSKMTVSRVLNHPEKVSPTIQADVLAAIDALGYVQNRAGRSLATNRHFSIGFVMLDKMDQVEPYFGNLILYIADELQHKGYTMSLHRSLDEPYDDVDGLLISGARPHDVDAINQLPVPSVSYGGHPGLNAIDVDNYAGTTLATNELLKGRYDHYLYLGLDMSDDFALDRERGFTDTIGDHLHTITHLSNEENAGTPYVTELLATHQSLGIIAATDRLALGAIRAAKRANKSIPTEVGVIGFDGVFINKISDPELSTIVQPLSDIAQDMVALLLEQLDSPLEEPLTRVLLPHFSHGATSPN